MSQENVELARQGYEAMNSAFSGGEILPRWSGNRTTRTS
jgi:hypothetical protein